MARILSPDDYGLIGMLTIFMSVSQIFIDGGFSSALIQKKQKSENDYSTAFYTNFGISILIYIILFVFSGYIADFYNQPILSDIIKIYGLNLIINALVSINKTILVVRVDFKTQSIISVVSALLSGSIGIVCAYLGMGVWAIVALIISSSIFNVIVSLILVRWIPKLIFSIDSFKSLFSFGSKLLIAQLVNAVYINIYNIAIGKKYTLDQLGYYTRADQSCQLVSTNISSILERVSFPILSELQDDNERLLIVYKRYLEISAFIMFPMILGLCGIAKPLILLLLSEKWEPSIILLQILCIGNLGNGIIRINQNLLYVKGRSDLVLKLEFIKKPLAILILFITMPFGVKFICVGFSIYSTIAVYINTYYTKKLLNFSIWNQLNQIMPYLGASVVLFTESIFISHFISNNILSLTISVIVCLLTYIGLCHYFGLYAYIQVKEHVETHIGKRTTK